MNRFEASWPITDEGMDMPRAELEAEAMPDLADMLHAEGLQALAEPEFQLVYTPSPQLHATVPVAPWTDPVIEARRARRNRSTEGTAA